MGNMLSTKMCLRILTLLAAFACLPFGKAYAQTETILESGILKGVADYSVGQSFTVSKGIEISSIEIFARKYGVGEAFTLTVEPYDPWTGVRQPPLASVFVAASSLPIGNGGDWMTIPFSSPVIISDPGVYLFFLEQKRETNGYNAFGFSVDNRIKAGRLVGFTTGQKPKWFSG